MIRSPLDRSRQPLCPEERCDGPADELVTDYITRMLSRRSLEKLEPCFGKTDIGIIAPMPFP
ncbi:hypothetical protein [Desulfonema ishimotonii]|uniref:hypothetical protein n=1 Tax=Desulfonema ishimotonii TaxID=45657 RepID=UPI001407BBDA|nr:hypothetical protein [Desulfonema ishimotonii]